MTEYSFIELTFFYKESKCLVQFELQSIDKHRFATNYENNRPNTVFYYRHDRAIMAGGSHDVIPSESGVWVSQLRIIVPDLPFNSQWKEKSAYYRHTGLCAVSLNGLNLLRCIPPSICHQRRWTQHISRTFLDGPIVDFWKLFKDTDCSVTKPAEHSCI